MEVVKGTLDFLILKTLSRSEGMHGFAILEWIKSATGGTLLIEEGSLYPALHRMEQRRWLSATWGISEKGRRAKYYRISPTGLEQLEREQAKWNEYVGAVTKIADSVDRV